MNATLQTPRTRLGQLLILGSFALGLGLWQACGGDSGQTRQPITGNPMPGVAGGGTYGTNATGTAASGLPTGTTSGTGIPSGLPGGTTTTPPGGTTTTPTGGTTTTPPPPTNLTNGSNALRLQK
jgi:hypothetical protein